MAVRVLNTWEECKTIRLKRLNLLDNIEEEIDPGVNFFVLMLEKLGCITTHSCESHASDNEEGQFYISFVAPYDVARELAHSVFFDVRIPGHPDVPAGEWVLERYINGENKNRYLSKAAEVWTKKYGMLNYIAYVVEEKLK